MCHICKGFCQIIHKSKKIWVLILINMGFNFARTSFHLLNCFEFFIDWFEFLRIIQIISEQKAYLINLNVNK